MAGVASPNAAAELQAWRCGALILAGEHCSRAKAWIEGAIASGQDAAAMVVCPAPAQAI
jgi:monoamine oxidase